MSMYPEEPLDPYLRELRAALGAGVTADIGMSVGIGIFTPSGRQVCVSIRELPGGLVELSDDEETISALVMQGALDHLNVPGFRARATVIAQAYGLNCNGHGAITWTGLRRDWIDAAKRICAASVAIDSWRWWMGGA